MAASEDRPLDGVRVLVVEDEALVAMLLEDMLGDLGAIVTATTGTVEEAVAKVRTGGLDVAILDVNLGAQSSAPVAEALKAANTPFVFATGYGESGVPEAFRGRPALQKPYGMNDVQRLLSAAVGR
ncbi:MAG: response regulator [Caulobacteraceae bacterium]|nr:response regulator [Caulobacter sp.]